MSASNRFLKIIAVVLILVTAYALYVNSSTQINNEVNYRDGTLSELNIVIETDKETYELNESITASVYFVNPTEENIAIEQILSCNIKTVSQYYPAQEILSVALTYPEGEKIKVNAGNRTLFLEHTFHPEYPGLFSISCMGAEKTMEVEGEIWFEVFTNNTGGSSLWIPSGIDWFAGGSETVNASNRFALDLYKQVNSGNLIFSPYSISTALSMLYEGAGGTTAEEIQEVFHYNVNTTQRLEENNQLRESLNNDRGIELNTANGLWVQTDYPILDEYHNRLTGFYGAEARQLNLAGEPEASQLIINDWVENKTQGKIEDLFPKDSFSEDTRLVLTNAVYFKGQWLYQFKQHETEQRPFYVTPNNTIQVDTMHLSNKKFNYVKNDEAQVIELPYRNSSLSMIVILPCNQTLTEMESNITMEKMESWINSMGKQYVVIYLPKYGYETKYEMVQILSDMGMPTVFDPGSAKLTGINPDGGLFVSKVIHQAFIEVDEEGTEAAAATGVVAELSALFGGEKFRADHPFMYLIMDKDTGAILFMGRVVDPSK